jgi:transketolase
MGDGECDEGQVWEAAMAAVHFKVDNLTAIVDNNGLQIDGPNSVVMSLAPFRQKWEAFGWHVIEVDGHDLSQLLTAFAAARKIKGQPSLVLAHTVKGKGVSFMENKVEYHGKVPGAAEIAAALKELA